MTKKKKKRRSTEVDPWALIELIRPRIRVGPMLRHVSPTSAVFWMELSAPARLTIEITSRGVLARRVTGRSFRVGTRNYALIAVDRLRPHTWYTYRIFGAGAGSAGLLWPDNSLPEKLPPSTFRTFAQNAIGSLRIANVSCRLARNYDDAGDDDAGVDALLLFAQRIRKTIDLRNQKWPDMLLMTGDQIYADNLSEPMRQKVKAARLGTGLPENQLIAFEEFAQAYAETWSHPDLRWAFSCIPSFMIFDDHEIVDDWNISSKWLNEMRHTSWWFQKYAAGLLAYWIYQGAGNLAPEEWDSDERMRAMLPTSRSGRNDSTGAVGALFLRYALSPSAPRFSYSIDVATTRIVVADLRYRRDVSQRLIMDDDEWNWFASTVRDTRKRNLLIVSSLPYLLPDAIHELETASEASNEFPWTLTPTNLLLEGVGHGTTWVRDKFDLEHWSAFSKSFNRMLDLLEELRGGGRSAPQFIAFLSGDVHFSYNMVGRLSRSPLRPFYQLVSSGARQALDSTEAAIISLMASPIGSAGIAVARGIAGANGVNTLSFDPKTMAQRARLLAEPAHDPTGWIWMGNFVATLTLTTARMECVYEVAHKVSGLNDDPAVNPYPNRRLMPRGRIRANIVG